MTVESQNRMTSLRKLRPGLAIYQTARSPYWMVRLRDPSEGRYIVRSTKETSRIEAMAAAQEFADSFFKKVNSDQARKATTSFEYYAHRCWGCRRHPLRPTIATASCSIGRRTGLSDTSAIMM